MSDTIDIHKLDSFASLVFKVDAVSSVCYDVGHADFNPIAAFTCTVQDTYVASM